MWTKRSVKVVSNGLVMWKEWRVKGFLGGSMQGSVVEVAQWCETKVYHVPLAFQCIYGCSDERGENGDGEEENEVFGGGERVQIAWPLVCR